MSGKIHPDMDSEPPGPSPGANGQRHPELNEKLLVAVIGGDLEEVKTLLSLEQRADVDTKDNLHWTPLMHAVEHGFHEIVKLLLEKKAHVDAKNKNESTPLHFAAKEGRQEIVKLLLEERAELDAKNNSGTPLYFAASQDHQEVVKLLLEARAELYAGIKNKSTPLCIASQKGYPEVVKLLLEARAEVDAKNGKEMTPLRNAALNKHREVVKLLLEARAEVDAKESELRIAVEDGHLEEVKKLLEKRADIDITRKNIMERWEEPLLCIASAKGHQEVVKLLLKERAEVDASEISKRMTPLYFAALCDHPEVVKLLLEARAEVDARIFDKSTPLCVASKEGHAEVAKLLLEARAEVDRKDTHERAPLFIAASSGHQDLVKLLLEERAGVGLGSAINAGRFELVDFLTEEVVKLNSWSPRLLIDIMTASNQDLIVKVIEKWPQEAKFFPHRFDPIAETLDRAPLPERLRPFVVPPHRKSTDITDERNVDLSRQNLFWAPQVQVALRRLPGLSAGDALNKDLLKTLADTPHDSIFETDAVQALVLAAWLQYRAFTLLDIGACIVTVVCLCFASYEYRHGPPFAAGKSSLFLVAILHMKKSVDELAQVCRHLRHKYRGQATGSYVNFDNLADTMYIVISHWLVRNHSTAQHLHRGARKALDGNIRSTGVAQDLIQPSRRDVDGPALASNSGSYQRHLLVLRAHGHVHPFGSACIL